MQTETGKPAAPRGKKKPLLIIICLLAAALLVVGAVLVLQQVNKGPTLAEQLALGDNYLLEMDYANALLAFEAAIAIDPLCAEAYIGAAEAHIGLGDLSGARDVLRQGLDAIGDDSRLVDMLGELSPQLTASHQSGDFEEAFALTLEASAGEIYYTTDGAEPDETTTPYTAPIPVEAETTIKAVAITRYGAHSAVYTGSFTFSRYVVQWQDSAVEQAVRDYLQQPQGDIYNTDLDGIEIFSAVGNTLRVNEVVDYNYGYSPPADVRAPADLFQVNIVGVGSVAPGPALTGPVTTLADFVHFAKLQQLRVCFQSLADTSALPRLQSLTSLYIEGSGLTDFSFLEEMPSLQTVWCAFNSPDDAGHELLWRIFQEEQSMQGSFWPYL